VLARAERGLRVGLAEVLEDLLPAPAVTVREGVDFRDPRGAARLVGGEEHVAKAPTWAMMLMRALRELRMHEATGQLPGGLCHAAQPAWKAELWEAYWQVNT